MDQAWTLGLDDEDSRDRTDVMIVGRTLNLGPLLMGWFRYDDDEGGGFCLVQLRGTRLGFNWEW